MKHYFAPALFSTFIPLRNSISLINFQPTHPKSGQTRQTKGNGNLHIHYHQNGRQTNPRRNILRRPSRNHRNHRPHGLHPHRHRNHPRRRSLGPSSMGSLPHHRSPHSRYFRSWRKGYGGDRLSRCHRD